MQVKERRDCLWVIGSNFRPKDGMGTAFSQSEELVEDTANILALSSFVGADANNF